MSLINNDWFCVWFMYAGAHGEIQRQHCGVASPLPPAGSEFWRPSSSHQAYRVGWQASLPDQLSYWLHFLKDYCVSFRVLSTGVTKTSYKSGFYRQQGRRATQIIACYVIFPRDWGTAFPLPPVGRFQVRGASSELGCSCPLTCRFLGRAQPALSFS